MVNGALKKCNKCGAEESTRWYSGPLCRKCYRAQPHIKEKEQESRKNWVAKNREKIKAQDKQYYTENKERIAAKNKKWYEANKDSKYQKQRKYGNFKKRYNSDVEFRLAHNLRNRLNLAIKRNSKSGSAVNDLGCSIGELKNHLESQFRDGMTWDNYGEWQIDHIRPLCKFDLQNREELLKACHYSNLQPLWAAENRRKNGNEKCRN